MWMKCTLRAEALSGGGGGGGQTLCFQLTQMLAESQRLGHKRNPLWLWSLTADRNEIVSADFSYNKPRSVSIVAEFQYHY